VNGNEGTGVGPTASHDNPTGGKGRVRRQDDWLGHTPRTASTFPTFPTWGISTGELALAQQDFTTYARDRLMGTGQEQYSRAGHQAFENMSVPRIIDETLDELADIVNYSTFLAITLQRLKQKLEEAL